MLPQLPMQTVLRRVLRPWPEELAQACWSCAGGRRRPSVSLRRAPGPMSQLPLTKQFIARPLCPCFKKKSRQPDGQPAGEPNQIGCRPAWQVGRLLGQPGKSPPPPLVVASPCRSQLGTCLACRPRPHGQRCAAWPRPHGQRLWPAPHPRPCTTGLRWLVGALWT